MKKKYLYTVSAILLTGTIALTGCSSAETLPKGDPDVSDKPIVKVLDNPILEESKIVGSVTFDNGVRLDTYYDGTGYATNKQIEIFKKGATEAAEENESGEIKVEVDKDGNMIMPEEKPGYLVEGEIVASIRYVLTNTSGSDVPLSSFAWSSSKFKEVEDSPAFDEGAESLHGLLGYASIPPELTLDPTATLANGGKAQWSLDVYIPKSLHSLPTATLIQDFTLGENTLTGVSIPVQIALEKPKTDEEK